MPTKRIQDIPPGIPNGIFHTDTLNRLDMVCWPWEILNANIPTEYVRILRLLAELGLVGDKDLLYMAYEMIQPPKVLNELNDVEVLARLPNDLDIVNAFNDAAKIIPEQSISVHSNSGLYYELLPAESALVVLDPKASDDAFTGVYDRVSEGLMLLKVSNLSINSIKESAEALSQLFIVKSNTTNMPKY